MSSFRTRCLQISPWYAAAGLRGSWIELNPGGRPRGGAHRLGEAPRPVPSSSRGGVVVVVVVLPVRPRGRRHLVRHDGLDSDLEPR